MASAGRLSSAPSGGGGDPYFSDVELLLKFDGTNNSTTFIDSSSNNKTITSNYGYGSSNAYISNTVSKFSGNTTGYFSSNSYGRITFPDIIISSGTDFTIETWFYTGSPSSDFTLCSYYPTSGGNHQMLRFNHSGADKFLSYNQGSMFNFTRSTSLSSNTWYHAAMTRENNVCKFFMDGVLESTNSSFNNEVKINTIGAGYGNSQSFDGYLDEFRITSGVARYTSSFTPPTAEFPTS